MQPLPRIFARRAARANLDAPLLDENRETFLRGPQVANAAGGSGATHSEYRCQPPSREGGVASVARREHGGVGIETLGKSTVAMKLLFFRISNSMIKRRSRILRRRTRQAALDKPRVHDGQLGFAILELESRKRLKNRAFEEKKPLVF